MSFVNAEKARNTFCLRVATHQNSSHVHVRGLARILGTVLCKAELSAQSHMPIAIFTPSMPRACSCDARIQSSPLAPKSTSAYQRSRIAGNGIAEVEAMVKTATKACQALPCGKTTRRSEVLQQSECRKARMGVASGYRACQNRWFYPADCEKFAGLVA